MSRRLIAFSAAALFLLGAMPALAQNADSEQPNRRIVYRSTTEINFDSLNVETDLKRPMSAFLDGKRRTNFNPLIQIRKDFNQEILNSVNQVR